MTTVTWDIPTFDWHKGEGKEAIASAAIAGARNGAVILVHDGECADQADNLAALETILSELRPLGYTFTAMPDSYSGSAVARQSSYTEEGQAGRKA